MAIHEWQCTSCGEVVEVWDRFDVKTPNCPKCDSENMTKLLSRGSFVLKGSGWFKDGYSKKRATK